MFCLGTSWPFCWTNRISWLFVLFWRPQMSGPTLYMSPNLSFAYGIHFRWWMFKCQSPGQLTCSNEKDLYWYNLLWNLLFFLCFLCFSHISVWEKFAFALEIINEHVLPELNSLFLLLFCYWSRSPTLSYVPISTGDYITHWKYKEGGYGSLPFNTDYRSQRNQISLL